MKVKKKFNFVYLTTNLINNKIYVGVHSTDDLGDGYIGSGKLLMRAVEKHGSENFKREILAFFDTKEDAYEFESILVDEYFIDREDTYNISEGGHGGFTGNYQNKSRSEKISRKLSGIKRSDEFKKKCSDRMKGKIYGEKNPMYGKGLKGEANGMYGKKHSDEAKKKMSEDRAGEKHPMYGKKHTEESKKKMSDNSKNKKTINNGVCDKRVNECDLEMYLSDGWEIGSIRRGKKANTYGKKHSIETKKKMSDAKKGVPKSESHRKKLSNKMEGNRLMTKHGVRKRVYQGQFDEFLSDGWTFVSIKNK